MEIIGFVSFAVAVVITVKRRKALKFAEIVTILPKDEQVKLFRELCGAYNIKPVVVHKDVLVLKFKPAWPEPGQRVTIVFDNGKILFNSITLPEDAFSRYRNWRFGENRTNFEIFKEEVADREQEYKRIKH